MADVTVMKIAGYVRVRILMIRWFFRIFRIHIFFIYGEFGDIKIKLCVQVTATAAASRSDVNLGQRGQSIILR